MTPDYLRVSQSLSSPMKRTRSVSRGQSTPPKKKQRTSLTSLEIGEDVVAYYAAQLVVSRLRWRRELGVALGVGLGNRAVYYRFRALAFEKVDQLYANCATRQHLPLPVAIVQPWLECRFPDPLDLSGELTRVYVRFQTTPSVEYWLPPLAFINDSVLSVIKGAREWMATRDLSGAVLLAFLLLRHNTTPCEILGLVADVTPTPLLKFMENHVIRRNIAQAPGRKLLEYIRERRVSAVIPLK
jgi:hypothetical protein